MKLIELHGLTRAHIAAMAGLAGIILCATSFVFLPPAMALFVLVSLAALTSRSLAGCWDRSNFNWQTLRVSPRLAWAACLLAIIAIIAIAPLARLAVGLVLLAIFFLPAYLPFLIIFTLRSSDGREMSGCLRLASIGPLIFAVISPPGLRSATSDSIGEGISVAWHNTMIHQAWGWSGSLACVAVALTIGLGLHLYRQL